MPYYQDLYDHVLRATDWTEYLRDLVTTSSRRTRDPGQPDEPGDEEGDELGGDHRGADGDDRLLRAERAYPGFATHWGFWFSSAVIVVMSVGLYFRSSGGRNRL